MSLEEIEILTYCHECNKAYNKQHKYCPGCGSTQLMLFVPGPTIKDWIETERKLETVKEKQCGCCNDLLYTED
jgi:primosomal protein N'